MATVAPVIPPSVSPLPTWDSNNVHVEMIAESIGLDSYEKIQQAFKEAITI